MVVISEVGSNLINKDGVSKGQKVHKVVKFVVMNGNIYTYLWFAKKVECYSPFYSFFLNIFDSDEFIQEGNGKREMERREIWGKG